ncbi:uncharacterized protein PHALS_12121 [Plasmopara halstedii]|uniref:Uncharacterized protein n=1 Tax=Plasmopara halstedii TaxID=4781 RepID=A0A0P1AK88_PLAHL|nr:uncharacterized protein PHALS_12121 [Plasmopara halstedii]CEG41798.1 hypothetical protein PHALS_12121 [Plasmopara halstedii]|eukprot:XP_024578167.1 hypothetical protein PHALS_12121 [Plasmopara halstedii]
MLLEMSSRSDASPDVFDKLEVEFTGATGANVAGAGITVGAVVAAGDEEFVGGAVVAAGDEEFEGGAELVEYSQEERLEKHLGRQWRRRRELLRVPSSEFKGRVNENLIG